MDAIITLLNKPIVLTLVTLTVGSYLFTRLTERRSKREKIREKALQLLEEVGNDLNAVMSLMYAHIRTNSFHIADDSLVNKNRAALFAKRFSVKIKSKAFLQSDEFWKGYEDLTFEIDKTVKFMKALSSDYDLNDALSTLAENQKQFADAWPREEQEKHSDRESLASELVIWTNMVWDRANSLISEHLNKVFR